MKTIISYKFDLEAIKNYRYFLVDKVVFSEVFFVPIGNQILFISPCQQNIYLTLSSENSETIKIKDYILNSIENNELNFNHIFSINEEEFKRFLKNAKKKDSFYFDITVENDKISGNCNILKNKKDINDNTVDFLGQVKTKNSKDHSLRMLLEFVLLKNYSFKQVDWNKGILNFDLKYYDLIDRCLKSYKNKLLYLKFFDDNINRLISVNIDIDDTVNSYHIQILIAYMFRDRIKDNEDNENNEDILSKLKKHLFAIN